MSRLNGRELNDRWDVGARHALYRKSGDWYHVPSQFPAALFDAHGYVRFETEEDLEITRQVDKDEAKQRGTTDRHDGFFSICSVPKAQSFGASHGDGGCTHFREGVNFHNTRSKGGSRAKPGQT